MFERRYAWWKRFGPDDVSPRRLVALLDDGKHYTIPEIGGTYYLEMGVGDDRRVVLELTHAAARILVEMAPMQPRQLAAFGSFYTLVEPAKGAEMSAAEIEDLRRSGVAISRMAVPEKPDKP